MVKAATKTYTWTEEVKVREAKAGDTAFYHVDNEETYQHVSEVVSNSDKADTLVVKPLAYSAADQNVTVKDAYVLRIMRRKTYEVPAEKGLYFDANNALYYQTDDGRWFFLYQPNGLRRNILQASEVPFDELDPTYFPFKKAKAVAV